MRGLRALAVCVFVVGTVGCDSTEPESSSTVVSPTETPTSDPTTSPDPPVEVLRDESIGDVTTADVYLPPEGEAAPVVVMLHGTEGERSELDGLAREVAASGALVYVPTWPAIRDRPAPQNVREVYRRQTEAVVCTLRHARATAADFGGDPDDLTLFGHSGGATVGARVALVDEPQWPGIDCYPGVSHAPARFIATAGDFTGGYSFSTEFPEQYGPYDVFGLVPSNDVEVRLYQGFNDWNVNPATEATALDEHLQGMGVDSQAAYLDAAHGDMIDVSEPAGRFISGQVTALVHGRPGVFDDSAAVAKMSYQAQRCSYEGPTSLGWGEPVAIQLENPTDGPVLYWLVGFEAGFDVVQSGYLDLPPASLDSPPDGVETGHWITVGASSVGLLRWVMVRGDQEWVPHCLPEAGTTAPGAGLMHATPVVLTMRH